MQCEQEIEDIILPPLRQDLQLQRGAHSATDQEQWLIYDPVNHIYHSLNEHTFHLLQYWQAAPAQDVLKAAEKATDYRYDVEDIKKVLTFLYQHNMSDAPKNGNVDSLIQQNLDKKKISGRKLLHSYVFFRIPLLKPQKLLINLSPYAATFFSRSFWIMMAGLFLLAAGLVSQQWDQFISTFFGFLSPEGMLGYGLAIILTKIAHEFGHAFAAHRYGCRVTNLGIGFMLLFPILYADTTDAWRLKSRRKRLVIGVAGMGAEIIIAIFATLLWNILPDGSLRAVMFFLASTSWVITIFVNLNPLMRFDGYYLLADLLDFQNLQPRSNALGQWWLRETLFKAGETCPEELPARLHNGLIFYAVCVWIYRFFLFLGIALLLHTFMVKAIALILSAVEIGWFIVRPAALEIKEWPPLIRRGNGKRRAITAGVFTCLGLIFFLPWQTAVKAPAVMEPSHEATIYAGLPGRVEIIHVAHGQEVQKNDPLLELYSPALATQMDLTRQSINLLQARVNRQATDSLERAQRTVLLRELAGEQEKLAGLEKLQADMVLRAPLDGIVHGISHDLHTGRWINSELALMHVQGTEPALTTAYITEDDIARIRSGAKASFYADDPLMRKTSLHVKQIAQAGTSQLDKPILASLYGGGVATRKNDQGELIPVRGLFRVSLESPRTTDRDVRGIVHIKGAPRSPAAGVWRRMVAIYNRETAS